YPAWSEPHLLVTGRGVVRCCERGRASRPQVPRGRNGMCCTGAETIVAGSGRPGRKQEEDRQFHPLVQVSGRWAGMGVLVEGSRAWAMAVKSAAEAAGGRPARIPPSTARS